VVACGRSGRSSWFVRHQPVVMDLRVPLRFRRIHSGHQPIALEEPGPVQIPGGNPVSVGLENSPLTTSGPACKPWTPKETFFHAQACGTCRPGVALAVPARAPRRNGRAAPAGAAVGDDSPLRLEISQSPGAPTNIWKTGSPHGKPRLPRLQHHAPGRHRAFKQDNFQRSLDRTPSNLVFRDDNLDLRRWPRNLSPGMAVQVWLAHAQSVVRPGEAACPGFRAGIPALWEEPLRSPDACQPMNHVSH